MNKDILHQLADFNAALEKFQNDPLGAETFSNFKNLSAPLAEELSAMDWKNVNQAIAVPIVKTLNRFLSSNFLEALYEQTGRNPKDSDCGCTNFLGLLFSMRAHQCDKLPDLNSIPAVLFETYVRYCIFSPEAFSVAGEADRYKSHIHLVLGNFSRSIFESPRSPRVHSSCRRSLQRS